LNSGNTVWVQAVVGLADRRADCLEPLRGLAFYAAAADVPPLAGAYVLSIQLDGPIKVRIAGRVATTVPEGLYLYCGSARGPGGLHARLRRHMRRHKTLRWHIDQITSRGRVLGAWVAPGGNECELVGRLSRLRTPIPGFGSSDCARCRSHLLVAE
jgi:Uri superfamily endonuclease